MHSCMISSGDVIREASGLTNSVMVTKATVISKINFVTVMMSLSMCSGSWVMVSSWSHLMTEHS